MTILAFGGEMGFFVPSESNAIEETGSLFHDGAFARSATYSRNAAYSESCTFTETADVWIHFDIIEHGSTSGSSTQSTAVSMLDGSGAEVFRITTSYQDTSIAISWVLQYNDGGTWTTIGTSFSATNSLQSVDVHIVAGSASGSADLYLSGTRRVAGGTIDLSAISGVAQIRGKGRTTVGVPGTALSQVIIADEPTIGWKLGTIYMSGQGTTHTFTTGGYNNVDETVYADGDFIQSDTADQVELFTGTSVADFSGYTIRAVGITARVKKSGTGPQQFQFALRSGGTTYFSATNALDFGYGAFCNVWETNPDGDTAWLSTDIAGLEYGLKSIT